MKTNVRIVEVQDVEQLSPHLQRITFAGESLENFPENQESAHVKVIVPDDGDYTPGWNYISKYRKVMRSYTVRAFDNHRKTLVIDFAINDHVGRITDWANAAIPGDKIAIAGPGGIKHKDFYADWHLIVGDLTALPAIAATLEKLPQDAIGDVIIQVPTLEDKLQLTKPLGVNLHWIVSPHQTENLLFERLKDLEWRKGVPSIFLACEASQVREIKPWLKTKPGFQSRNLYDSAYWKRH
jgi:NADPH-dependent ferric siderophore reductase